MKKLFLFIGIVFAGTMIACGPTTDDAIKHNDGIVADQKKLLEMENDFVNTIVDGDEIADIKKAYKEYNAFIEETLKKYEDMDEFDSNDTFRKAMLDLLKEFQDVANNEYKEMVDIYTMDAEDLTEDDFTRWEELAQIVEDKEGKANDSFLDKQKEFAKEYNFTLE
ncbi:MAG: hypothetical protein CVU11_03415 [Bacteroidetes bacterium HGW-Bacteroidetes-6]|jgi:hypothetical protein|nr:MAG: hypothetical protein CVU11_03415 [Bacteroidetes bacterium HGW-Bacteroidetes-6]